MLKPNSIKTDDILGSEGISDEDMPLWKFVERWEQIQSGTSQDTHAILENIESQESIEEQRQELLPELLSQEYRNDLTRISEHSFDEFLEGLRPRIRMWYDLTLRAIHSLHGADDGELDAQSVEIRFIMYHYLFVIFDTHESVFSKIVHYPERLNFVDHFHRDPLQSIVQQKNQLPKNDFSDRAFEKWFKYFVQMKYSLEQLRHWTQRDKGGGEPPVTSDSSEPVEPVIPPEPYQPLPFWDDLSDERHDDFVREVLFSQAYDATFILAIKEMIACAHVKEVAISKKIDAYSILHHRITDAVQKQYFRDSVKSFKDSIVHLPNIPDHPHDYRFFLDFFRRMIEWEDIQKNAEIFVREQIGDPVQASGIHQDAPIVGGVLQEKSIVASFSNISTDTEIAKIAKNMDKRRARCSSVEKTKKIQALQDLQTIENDIGRDLEILKNKQQQAIVQTQIISQIVDEAHKITEMIHKLKEELHALDEQRKWAHRNRESQNALQGSLFQESADSDESRELTDMQKEYIAYIRMVQGLFVSSTFDKNNSKSDGQTSTAVRNFLYFFIQKIEEGKILSGTTQFSWRELYLLRKQDHQMNTQNRSDNINQNLFEILEHDNSILSHIPGAFAPADFYQAFKSLYNIVEKYAQTKQKSLRSSKQACQLYLQNLHDAGIYHKDIDK